MYQESSFLLHHALTLPFFLFLQIVVLEVPLYAALILFVAFSYQQRTSVISFSPTFSNSFKSSFVQSLFISSSIWSSTIPLSFYSLIFSLSIHFSPSTASISVSA